jgi:hypothetical protein
MSRWIRHFQVLLAVLIAGAVAVDWAAGGGLAYTNKETPTTTPTLTATGDSTSYTLYDCLLPSPTADSTWAVLFNDTAFDSLTYDAYYDTLVFDVSPCRMITLYARGDWDSLWYWVDYSMDGQTWTAWQDSTVIDATVARSFPPTRSDWSQKLCSRFYLDDGVVDTLKQYDVFMWQQLRVIMRNGDAMAYNVGDSALVASTVADTAINVQWKVFCGE